MKRIVIAFFLIALPIIGNAGIRFDGSNDYVNCGMDSSLDITSKITLSAWVKPLHHFCSIVITKRATNNVYHPIQYEMGVWNDGTVHFVFYNGAYRELYSSTSIDTGEWSLISVTFSNPDVKIYINGILDTVGNLPCSLLSDSVPVTIGNGIGSAAGGYPFNGIVEDVAVWEDVLTSNDIYQLYEAKLKYMPLQIRADALRLYLPCDDLGEGSDLENATFTDFSGYGNDGTGNDEDGSGGQGYGTDLLMYPIGLREAK